MYAVTRVTTKNMTMAQYLSNYSIDEYEDEAIFDAS